jgi:hypothetical protein
MITRYREGLVVATTETGKRFYRTVLPSIIQRDGIEFVIRSRPGDRFDILANEYYGDSSKWWIIAKANNLVDGTIFIPGGTELVIPSVGL